MGNGEIRLSNDLGSVKQYVDIQRSRTFCNIPGAVVLPLDFKADLEQFIGGKDCVGLYNCVKKPWLIEYISRLGRINGRASRNVYRAFRKAPDASAKMLFSIPKVGSQRQVNKHPFIIDEQRMKTHITKTPLEGVVIIDIEHFHDERGFFIESWNKRDFQNAGLSGEFVQDSHSRSSYGVLRGLHYQDMRAPMAKLVRCTVGRIMDVAVDLRLSSPTFGRSFTLELTAENRKQLFIPIGFAHGFVALSDVCEVQYKQTGFYEPATEGGIAWNDPDVGIHWPLDNPILSKRDQNQMSLKQYRENPAFR
jgi:dTDP-4-dehydrorhamnose 3,5-epimerase